MALSTAINHAIVARGGGLRRSGRRGGRGAGGAIGPVLNALSLTASSVLENTGSGSVIGAFTGKTAGSTLSLFDSAGSRFALSGLNLLTGAVATDFETATSHSITIRETLAGAANTPRDTVLTITVTNVFEQPNLAALALSASSFTIGTPSSGTITGAAAGQAISVTGLPPGLTINGPARTWAYDGSGPAATPTLNWTGTLADSANSPFANSQGITVAAAVSLSLDFSQADNSQYIGAIAA